MGVGYVAVDDRVDEILVVDMTTVDELFGVTIDDFDVIVDHFVEVDDIFVVVIDIFVVDGTRFGIPLGAGAPLTTNR